MKLFPGMVFTAEHYDSFTRSFKVHYFVCVRVTGLDYESEFKDNVVGVMLTSTNRADVIPLRGEYSFLSKETFVLPYTSMLFSLSGNDIKACVGQLTPEDFREVILARQEEAAKELRQSLHAVVNISAFVAKRDN